MAEERPPSAPHGHEAEELIALIDRLEQLFRNSELAELEVESSDTALVLRSAAAVAPAGHPAAVTTVAGGAEAAAREPGGRPAGESPDVEASELVGLHAVLAPLTGIFYVAPAPDASPYVEVGAEVREGQVIGLIEAMKLFNEIKSDVTGKVVRIAAENGTLVKARQPLIEVEPA